MTTLKELNKEEMHDIEGGYMLGELLVAIYSTLANGGDLGCDSDPCPDGVPAHNP